MSYSTIASKKKCLLALATAFIVCHAAAAPLEDLSGGKTGRIEFQATNPPSREALIRDRLGPGITILGDLLMPTKNVQGKVPAAIFSHGSESVSRMHFDMLEIQKANTVMSCIQ